MRSHHVFPQPTCFCITRGIMLLALLGLTACGGGGGDSGAGNAALIPAATQPAVQLAQETFAATLSGADEVPLRVTAAQGAAVIVGNPSSRQALIMATTANVAGTFLQLGQGSPGTLGPVLLSIAETLPGGGIWAANTVLSADQYSNLAAGNLHVNVLSQSFPAGEIRGQVVPQAVAGGTAVGTVLPSSSSFISTLNGAQAVPAAATAAQGAAAITVNPSNLLFTAGVLTTGMVGTGAELRNNPAGLAGSTVIALAETRAGSGVWTARGTLTEAQYAALQQGNFFVSVRSAAFPDGEIRGVVLPQTRFTSSAVPASAIGTSGAGTATAPAATGTIPTDIGTVPVATGIGTVNTGLGTSSVGTGATAIGSGTTGTTIGNGMIGTTISGLGISPGGLTTGTGGLGTGTIGTGITTGIGSTGLGTTGIGTTSIGTGTTGVGSTTTDIGGSGTRAGFNTTLTGTGTGTGTGMTGTSLNVN